jgi:hypothetical protein
MSDGDIIVRAFALARSGSYRDVADVRRQLKSEGFANVEGHLSGRSITQQLRTSIAEVPAVE